jgi:hypothetical protein
MPKKSSALNSKSSKGFAEAERRIEQVILSKNKDLDLSGLALTHLPEKLRELTWLRLLFVHNNNLTAYERLGEIDSWDDTRIVPGQKWEAEILSNFTER